ncbi:hypothetical protein Fmac_025014 [Flemingia macrophylla]|uniref:Cation/H+ exchanger domain-containing protein n=1 Tax=Flemingia macrophylla TaxID=520843 RepID=A0ABD1LR51_9FABA
MTNIAPASIPILACYNTTLDISNKIWSSDDVLATRVPLLCIQIAYNIIISSILHHIFKPFHLPRLVAQILGGVILSSSLMGKIPIVLNSLYRAEGILGVENFGNVGIMYHVFLGGLEMNCDAIIRSSKKAVITAIACILIPMLVGAGFLALEHRISGGTSLTIEGYLFWCAILSVTGFPVLARLLSGIKILYTRLGKDALAAAMLIDAYGWILFTLLIPYSNKGGRPLLSAISTLLFIVFCFCLLRPILNRVIKRRIRSDTWDNSKMLDVIIGLFVCSYITDMLGTHHVIGAFVYGLILPSGKFSDMMMETLDDFVSGVIAPVYFSGFGFRLDLKSLWNQSSFGVFPFIMMVLLATPKILSSVMVTCFFGMSARDGLGLGLLLNTKGVMAILLLSVAWDKNLLDPYAFTVMMVAVLVMTVMVSPLINVIYKPRLQFMQTQLRTVQTLRIDAELRVVACVHNANQATGMIHILEALNATRISPLHVSVLHLVKLTRHGTGLLVAQVEGGFSESICMKESESIAKAFEEFTEEYNAVRFETSSIVSSYETIHEDIYHVTEEQRGSLILLPFHKQINSEGVLEVTDTAFSDINLNVLQHPPCSAGIFVNRGLGSLMTTRMSIVVVFIGGADDREALSIAWRMAGHSGTKLHAIRLIVLGSGEAAEQEELHYDSNGMLSTVMDRVVQKELDEECIFHFRHKGVNNNDSIVYSEKEVKIQTGEEIPLILSEVDELGCDLYIFGRGSGENYPVVKNMLEWCDNPELGIMGDIVASTSFGTNSSLLVVQQYTTGTRPKPQRRPKKCNSKKNGSVDIL